MVIPATVAALALSPAILAKGKPYDKGPDARWRNSNKQSGEYSTRGRERAEERHEFKKRKDYHKEKKKYREDYKKRDRNYDEHQDRYRRQYEEERNGMDRRSDYGRYEDRRSQQPPVDYGIDRTIEDAKSRVDDIHRRTIDSIDNRTREIIGIEPRN